jgi:hypothetical protein
MAYVKVKLVAEGQTYDAEVDENANPAALVRSFVKQLPELPDDNYRIAFVDTLKIRDGAKIELVRVKPPEPGRILRKR